MKLSILAPLVAAVLAVPVACSPGPGQHRQPDKPAVPGTRTLVITCQVKDQNGRIGDLSKDWPTQTRIHWSSAKDTDITFDGPRDTYVPTTSPTTVTLFIQPGASGVFVSVACRTAGLHVGWIIQCDTTIDGRPVPGETMVFGPFSKAYPGLAEVQCEYGGL